MTDNPSKVFDICARLYVFAVRCEIGFDPPDRTRTAAIIREATNEIRRPRRRISALKLRLARLQAR
jgi:hypothetical protein